MVAQARARALVGTASRLRVKGVLCHRIARPMEQEAAPAVVPLDEAIGDGQQPHDLKMLNPGRTGRGTNLNPGSWGLLRVTTGTPSQLSDHTWSESDSVLVPFATQSRCRALTIVRHSAGTSLTDDLSQIQEGYRLYLWVGGEPFWGLIKGKQRLPTQFGQSGPSLLNENP